MSLSTPFRPLTKLSTCDELVVWSDNLWMGNKSRPVSYRILRAGDQLILQEKDYREVWEDSGPFDPSDVVLRVLGSALPAPLKGVLARLCPDSHVPGLRAR
jgi:hypothetical protein